MEEASFDVTLQQSQRGVARVFAWTTYVCLFAPIAGGVFYALASMTGFRAIWFEEMVSRAPLLCFPAAFGATLATGIAHVRSRKRAARVKVTPEELHFTWSRGGRERSRVVARSAIASVLVSGEAARDVEVVSRSGATSYLVFALRSQALTFARVAGRARCTSFVAMSPFEEAIASWFALISGIIMAVLGLAGVNVSVFKLRHESASEAVNLAALGGAILAMLALRRALGARRIIVGSDAVIVERFFGRARFPLASIVKAPLVDGTASIIVCDRKRPIRLVHKGDPRAYGIASRIREAIEARDAGGASSALVARGERSISEWKAAMRAMLSLPSAYRQATLPLDALVRVAENTSAPLDQRIGAALAVGYAGDDGATAKVRIAAQGIADGAARTLMARAAEGTADDARLDALTSGAKR